MATETDTVAESQKQSYDCFFYGTLCVPAVLIRVLGHKCQGLTFQDALLPNYTRHVVKGEKYPAIIDRERTNMIASRGDVLMSEEVNTRGTLVKGLSYADINALDIFEGTEYSRVKVPVQALTRAATIDKLPPALSNPTTRVALDNLEAEKAVNHFKAGSEVQDASGKAKSKFLDTFRAGENEDKANGDEKPSVVQGGLDVGMTHAWTYLWADSTDRLEPKIWSFEDFLRAKESAWNNLPEDWFDDRERQNLLRLEPGVTGDSSQSANTDDDPHADGEENQILGRTMDGFPRFGHDMLKYWGFNKGYVNLNHGSYGSPPRPVIEKMRALADQTEGNPDYFMRRAWLPLLTKVREEVSDLIGARHEELVIVPNTTHGVNTILNNFDWQDGDVLAIYSTTYGAVGQMAKYVADKHPQIKVEIIDVTFPCSHKSVVEITEKVLQKYNKPAIPNYTGLSKPTGVTPHERVKAVIIDAIASNPGVVYPWEEIVRVCKKYGAMSIVDAAHAVGQVEVDVKRSDCDFWVSNCHKWLMSHRGGAVLYVPMRNQYLIRSSFPTSAGYESSRYPTEGVDRPWSFVDQFSWTGTQDWTPFFSITYAFEFRRSIGGEKRIRDYCHTLAVQGGRRLRKKWGTQVMDVSNGELTAAMVNVALPHIPDPKDLSDQLKQQKYFEDKCFEGNTFVAAYRHGGKWWARFSAQVWNDLSDFDYAGDVVEQICKDIKEGKHVDQNFDEKKVEEEAKDLPTHDE
ncbi:hypothetical protein IAT40_002596 [Kwoniella sp. CBS 6097]